MPFVAAKMLSATLAVHFQLIGDLNDVDKTVTGVQ